MLGDVNKLFVFKSLLTTPSNVLPLHLKQTFPPTIWIFTEGEGDGIKSRLPFKTFSTLKKTLPSTKECFDNGFSLLRPRKQARVSHMVVINFNLVNFWHSKLKKDWIFKSVGESPYKMQWSNISATSYGNMGCQVSKVGIQN